MSPNLQRYLRSISASHPNSGATSQARPPVPAPYQHPAPIPPANHQNRGAAILARPPVPAHRQQQAHPTPSSHNHWHSIPGTPGSPARRHQHIFPIPLPDRHYWEQRHRPTSPRSIVHGITEDHQVWHHQAARRHLRRPSSMASPSCTTASHKTIGNDIPKPRDGTAEAHQEWHHQEVRRVHAPRAHSKIS